VSGTTLGPDAGVRAPASSKVRVPDHMAMALHACSTSAVAVKHTVADN
jgi:hypothetical protein